MELNKIEGLLEKYDKGATTLIEEAQLRDYFSQEIIPYHLESYKQLFSYFESDAKQFAQTPIMLRIQFPKKNPLVCFGCCGYFNYGYSVYQPNH